MKDNDDTEERENGKRFFSIYYNDNWIQKVRKKKVRVKENKGKEKTKQKRKGCFLRSEIIRYCDQA